MISAAQSRALRATPLPLPQTMVYSAGQLIDGMLTQSLNTFLFFYLTGVCGLSSLLTGIALAAGLVVDAVLDPLIGSASDGWHSRLGRRLPFMLLGLPLTTLSYVLMFSLPQGLDQTTLFLIVLTLSITLRLSLSMYLLPYIAVGAELSDDPTSRNAIVAFRIGVGIISTIVAIGLGMGVFFAGDDGLSRHEGYAPYGLAVGGIALVGGISACWSVLQTRNRQHAPAPSTEHMLVRLRAELGEVLRNASFRTLFAATLLLFVGLGIYQSLATHLGTFFWKLTSLQIQAMALAVPVGMLISVPLAMPALRYFEKRTVLVFGLFVVTLVYMVPPALRLLGWLPIEGAPLATFLTGSFFVAGVLITAAAIAFNSMLADAADEHEHLFGGRREGLYFAAWTFSQKAAAALGSLVAGLILSAIDFPSGVTKLEQAADIPQRTIDLLGLFAGPGGGLVIAASALCAMRYQLSSRKHAALLLDLSRRRDAAEAAQQPAV